MSTPTDNRDEYMAHMKGFSDGAGIKSYKPPENKALIGSYENGYIAGKESYRRESRDTAEFFDYEPLEVKAI